MNSIQILWVDDEIDLLKPHIIFLEQKGYQVSTCTNGTDAIDLVEESNFDIIFLDENMPGINGLETLNAIKQIKSSVPVVMITKSEEEYIMEEAIPFSAIDDCIDQLFRDGFIFKTTNTLSRCCEFCKIHINLFN